MNTKQIVAGCWVATAALIGAPLASADPQPLPPCDVEAVPADAEVECAPIQHAPAAPDPNDVAGEDMGPGSGGLGDSPGE
jgi:hypothetical protein